MPFVDIAVIVALVAVAAWVIFRAIRKRKDAQANPFGCAGGCCGCTGCPSGRPDEAKK